MLIKTKDSPSPTSQSPTTNLSPVITEPFLPSSYIFEPIPVEDGELNLQAMENEPLYENLPPSPDRAMPQIVVTSHPASLNLSHSNNSPYLSNIETQNSSLPDELNDLLTDMITSDPDLSPSEDDGLFSSTIDFSPTSLVLNEMNDDEHNPESPEGDSIYKTELSSILDISNCEEEDGLLFDQLKETVEGVERRLRFYFKQQLQMKNIKYCYDMCEKIAIQDAHGIPLLVQLLKTSDVYEIQELVTGVFWNLSSSEHLKLTILRLAMEALVKNIIIPQSGWSSTRSDHIYNNIEWTTVFRNATGCLRNLSSAGLEGRKAMRSCPGLVDALLYTLRAVQGKNDVDNKAVENAVCILRNLSYRLESEVTAEQKYGQVEDWRNKGLGGGTFRQKGEENVSKRKKQAKKQKGKENASPMPEHTTGVGLLWQPTVVRTYLDLLLECSNPETLEGAVGALQNLTAPSWQPAEAIRETVRKEKGLSVITSLLRMPNDTVVRATAICLRNLALDIKNKDLLGRNAMHDLVKRLPGGDGSDGMTDVTIAAVICALNEVILTSSENCKVLKDTGGVARLVQVARSQDIYPIQCVIMSNEMLVRCWEFKELKRCIKQQGWTLQLYRQMPGMIDKSDGLEYDESKNQFNASYNSGLDRHSRRDIRQQQEEDHIDHSSSHHNMRAATLGRSFDPSLEYHRPERPTDKGQSLPARGYKEQYGVSDSWV